MSSPSISVDEQPPPGTAPSGGIRSNSQWRDTRPGRTTFLLVAGLDVATREESRSFCPLGFRGVHRGSRNVGPGGWRMLQSSETAMQSWRLRSAVNTGDARRQPGVGSPGYVSVYVSTVTLTAAATPLPGHSCRCSEARPPPHVGSRTFTSVSESRPDQGPRSERVVGVRVRSWSVLLKKNLKLA